jgi:prolyl-tRNA editing enzyme YbaK/EbsC (Cys-tRNA(Pro) deacylase)
MPLRTLMDERLLELPLIYAAAGAHDALFPIEPELLLDQWGQER